MLPTNGMNWMPDQQSVTPVNNFNTGSFVGGNPGAYTGTAVNSQMRNSFHPQYIRGRIIQNATDVYPNEVPMDGNISLFPMADGSTILMKYWDSNGTIRTTRYIIEKDSTQTAVQDPMAPVLERLDKIESMLANGHNNRPFNQNKNNGGKSDESASK